MKRVQDRNFFDKINPVSKYQEYTELYKRVKEIYTGFFEYEKIHKEYVSSKGSDNSKTALLGSLRLIISIDNVPREIKRQSRLIRDKIASYEDTIQEIYTLNTILNRETIPMLNSFSDIFNEENTKFADKVKRLKVVAGVMSGGMFCRNKTRSKRQRKNATMKLRFIY